MKRLLRKLRAFFLGPIIRSAKAQSDLLLYADWRRTLEAAKNPLNKCGAKFFSQTDEDGITLEILRRLGLAEGAFAEFGVGSGTENNTLILLALGWRGFWAGDQDLAFDHRKNLRRFAFLRRRLDRENIVSVFREGLGTLGLASVDVLGLDLDGNDIYLVEGLLESGARPKLFIVEYNGRFPPPVRWQIEYDGAHVWRQDDYFGASIASFQALFARFGYALVCCNAHTGANAFFVRDELLGSFADVPRAIEDLFFPARCHLYQEFVHEVSPRTIERMLE
jgi:hypothetical protein